MRLSSFCPTLSATALILTVLAVIASFFLGDLPHGSADSASQQSVELSWSTGNGDGSAPLPASESNYSDYNPSCNNQQIIPVFRPVISPLVGFEPFTAFPKVYLERFVPPQNLNDRRRIS